MPILRSYYSEEIKSFLADSSEIVLGRMLKKSQFPVDIPTRNSWAEQIEILQGQLSQIDSSGKLFFEFSIPRLGKRIDVLLITGSVIYILEFKTGDSEYTAQALDQAWDYALDLKNFHKTSHDKFICPFLIVSKYSSEVSKEIRINDDNVFEPVVLSPGQIAVYINRIQNDCSFVPSINIDDWEDGFYEPTPTIIEAASALFKNHDVKDISRSDASAVNLTHTTEALEEIVKKSKEQNKKSICFVTGVPGAGKTLVGLNIATKHRDEKSKFHSVFLSGNAPLVTVLREALVRDSVSISRQSGERLTKSKASQSVHQFIQNVHHFRDACISDPRPPVDHVVIFDEAQRAWNTQQTSNFMRRKKGIAGFSQSEPDFLISCMDRHKDWAVIICLVGGGQEINTGEAGISAWLEALASNYPEWNIYLSPHMTDSEYKAEMAVSAISGRDNIFNDNSLHLSVSMRSFRAETVSNFVKSVLDLNSDDAINYSEHIQKKYPMRLTRSIDTAKKWIRETARGSERYGMVVSSQASRLKPLAIDIRVNVDAAHWFLGDKADVRSSWYLEDVATEFVVQGLELDWVCMVWDADFRLTKEGWKHSSFVGDKWQNIHKKERQEFLKNAYRVLLTRARQGMVVVVPEGTNDDPTRSPHFYDETYNYLKNVGLEVIQ
jgi:hypothetical protein